MNSWWSVMAETSKPLLNCINNKFCVPNANMSTDESSHKIVNCSNCRIFPVDLQKFPRPNGLRCPWICSQTFPFLHVDRNEANTRFVFATHIIDDVTRSAFVDLNVRCPINSIFPFASNSKRNKLRVFFSLKWIDALRNSNSNQIRYAVYEMHSQTQSQIIQLK